MLSTLAWVSLIAAFGCALIIAMDEARHPQKMFIMNLVWPITALYFSVFALWVYFRIGRPMGRDAMGKMPHMNMEHAAEQHDPTWQQTAVATSHCGAGCTLGDIIAEFSIMGLGLTLFGSPLYASFAADLFLAWLPGIAFQYFSIKPMRNLSASQALVAPVGALLGAKKSASVCGKTKLVFRATALGQGVRGGNFHCNSLTTPASHGSQGFCEILSVRDVLREHLFGRLRKNLHEDSFRRRRRGRAGLESGGFGASGGPLRANAGCSPCGRGPC